MSLPAHHAWTHRPKALGGTDPLEIAAAGPVSAIARSAGLVSVTLTGTDPINFVELARSPGSGYAPDTADPTNFEYILLPEDGFYMADFNVYWGTDFGASTFPFVEPSAVIAGTPTNLVTAVEFEWNNTQGWIGGEQFDAGELAHQQLVATVWFSYTAAYSDPAFGIGVNMRSSFAGAKTVGGSVAVTRLGDALELVT